MTQNFENHVRIVPGYHYVTLGIFGLNLIWSIYRVVRRFSAESVIALLLAVAFVLAAYYARIFALAVQDRVIRLEMRLRLAQVLPSDLRSRVNDFTVGQLVALRFASDEELPELALKVLAKKIADRKAIKRMIRQWNPDFLRA